MATRTKAPAGPSDAFAKLHALAGASREFTPDAAALLRDLLRDPSVKTRGQREENRQRALDEALLEHLAQFPLEQLRRIKQLVPKAIAKKESLALSPRAGRRPNDPKREQLAATVHKALTKRGLSSGEAGEVVSALYALALDGRTVRRYRANAGQKPSKKSSS